MEDSTENANEERQKTTDGFAAGRAVPEDVAWDLVAQNPVNLSEHGRLTPSIISTVAEAEGVSPKDIKDPPLYEVLDTAALEAAFFPANSNRVSDTDVSTEFMYRGYRVTVRSDGWVLVYEPREG